MPRALVILLRGALARRWGVRAARIYAVMVSISVTATIWFLARRFGPDATSRGYTIYDYARTVAEAIEKFVKAARG